LQVPRLALRWRHWGCHVPIMTPTLADPEIAAAVFTQHLADLWATGRPVRLGWERVAIDNLHVVVKLPAKRASGTVDPYYFRLGAEYYDAAPPTVAVVQPHDWTIAPEPSRWFPRIEPRPTWFGLHSAYDWPDRTKRQLVCFTFSAEYYMTDHSPKDTERWQQGRHTVAATLCRLAEVLLPPYYQHPSNEKGSGK
jgi:hypothetical protein